MDSGSGEGSEARFAAYVEALGAVLGHVDRQQPMHDYCLGLLMPIERKSVEPMAAVTAPAQVAAKNRWAHNIQAVRYEPRPSWFCSCSAEMPLECVAITSCCQNIEFAFAD